MAYQPLNPNGQATMANSQPVVIASNQSAVPVSGTVTANIGTIAGLATEVTLSAINGKMAALGQGLMAASMPVVIASNQSAIPVSGTFWQATQPISAAALPLPAGAATEATLANVATQATLSALNGKFSALGQNTMANSTPVVLASNQSAIPVSQSGTWNVGTVTTVTTVTSLTQMNGQAIAMGTGVRSAGTQRVTIATDDLVPISAASLPLPTGAATEATLSALSAKLPAAAAAAEGTANPTTTIVMGANVLFNGVGWDRERANFETTTGDSGAKTASGTGATQTNHSCKGAFIVLRMGAVSGTTPTFNMQLQFSPDGGVNWFDFGPASGNLTAGTTSIMLYIYPTNTSGTAGATPANITTNATQTVIINAALPRTWRIKWTIGGTTPSFTITTVSVSYLR